MRAYSRILRYQVGTKKKSNFTVGVYDIGKKNYISIQCFPQDFLRLVAAGDVTY